MLSVARYSMLPSIYEKAVKPTANGMDLNYQRKTKNSFISKGFAHGYLVLSEWAEFCL